jgi:endonuclease YncB( thermonuclease family)
MPPRPRVFLLVSIGTAFWLLAAAGEFAVAHADERAAAAASRASASEGTSSARPARAEAASAAQAASACAFGTAETARVAAVVDGRGLRLEDGREVRIAGIEVPPLPGPGESGPAAEAALAAKAALAALVDGRLVVLRDVPAKPDRYGRFPAQVFFAEPPGRPIAEALLTQGQAMVGVGGGDPRCRAELLTAERAARASKLGLWDVPYYEIRQAGQPAQVLVGRGRFALVEGRVVSVRESGATIYLNFGRRWSEDFTVTILKRNERLFSASGRAPKTLEGRRVRIRGWIEERGGPWIEASRPEQIEIAEDN